MGEIRILIVDDEKYIRELLAELLLGEGFEVDTAAQGEQALNKLAQKDFEVMISDVRMPVMDGLRLLKTVKQRHPEVAVVMMTGFTQEYTIRELISLGADEYLSKPFRQEEVLLMVQRAYQKTIARRRSPEALKSA